MTFWIDTHCHLDAPELAADLVSVRQRAAAAGHFENVRMLAHQFGDSYALGIHPLYTPQARDSDLAVLDAALARHANDPRLVAVGEIGLDYFVPGLDDARQQHFYREQLRLARKHGLPVIVHVRRSADQLLKHLRDLPVTGGIAHAFNGSLQQARAFVALGFRLGFGGTVTFERALQIRRLATELPLQALVMETDSPDIAPQWLYRTAQQRSTGESQGRNEPAELPRIAQTVAQLRGVSLTELAQATTRNACLALPRLTALVPQF